MKENEIIKYKESNLKELDEKEMQKINGGMLLGGTWGSFIKGWLKIGSGLALGYALHESC